jgi:hypothetical protein
LKKQLKQDLKKQEARKNKADKKLRWFLLVLLFVATIGGFYPVYLQRQVSAPKRLINRAIEQESLGQIATAEKLYHELYQSYNGTEEAAAALFHLGKLQQYDHRDARLALLSYLQLEKEYPESRLLAAARRESARIVKYSLRDYSQAIGY